MRSVDPLTRTQRSRVRRFSACEKNRSEELPPDMRNEDEIRRMRSCRVVPFSVLEIEGEEPFADRLASVETPAPDELAHDIDVIRRVFAWVDELPERERQVIDGIYRKRKSAHEVAQSLSLTDGRVSQLHHHGLHLLRERWISSVSR